MKIFSLESKKSVVIWAVVLGLAVNVVLSLIVKSSDECLLIGDGFTMGTDPVPVCILRGSTHSLGWPLQVSFKVSSSPDSAIAAFFVNPIFYWNLLFWFLIVSILLSLIRHFRYKKVSIKVT